MTHDPFTCTPDEKVIDIIHTMEAQAIRRMAVIEPNTDIIVSEVTIHQLIRRYYEIIEPLCVLYDDDKDKYKKKKLKKKGIKTIEN